MVINKCLCLNNKAFSKDAGLWIWHVLQQWRILICSRLVPYFLKKEALWGLRFCSVLRTTFQKIEWGSKSIFSSGTPKRGLEELMGILIGENGTYHLLRDLFTVVVTFNSSSDRRLYYNGTYCVQNIEKEGKRWTRVEQLARCNVGLWLQVLMRDIWKWTRIRLFTVCFDIFLSSVPKWISVCLRSVSAVRFCFDAVFTLYSFVVTNVEPVLPVWCRAPLSSKQFKIALRFFTEYSITKRRGRCFLEGLRKRYHAWFLNFRHDRCRRFRNFELFLHCHW